mmetsp:Transcript_22212/g.19736  ORF Transcript_22212/g.19736 Transcript_22212/m.19736 type:complete len:91 (+) Transcript_22212:1031-1303(+)
MQRFYEAKTMRLVQIQHYKSFKFLAYLLNDNKSFLSLLLSMKLWQNYSKMLLFIFAQKPKRNLCTTYADQGIQATVAKRNVKTQAVKHVF